MLILWVTFLPTFHFKILSFAVFVLTLELLIFYLFVRVSRISVYWTWNISLSVLVNCLWFVSKPEIRICFPCRFWMVVDRVMVECNCLLTSVDWFSWSKISLKFFTQAYFCWLLIFGCYIYVLELIYPKTCPWLWLKIVCGPYPNRTYVYVSPAGLWNFMARVPVFSYSCRHQLIAWYQGEF